MKSLFTVFLLLIFFSSCKKKEFPASTIDSSTVMIDTIVTTTDINIDSGYSASYKILESIDTNNIDLKYAFEKLSLDNSKFEDTEQPNYEYETITSENEEKARQAGITLIGDTVIKFSLLNGKTKELKQNITDSDDNVVYKVMVSDDLNRIGYWLVSVLYYEDWGMFLVNKKNGADITISGLPVFSNDKQYFLCNGYNGYEDNYLSEIWKIENDKLIAVSINHENNNCSIEKMIWMNDKQILSDYVCSDTNENGSSKEVVMISL